MYDLNSLKQEIKQTEEWLAKEYSQLHTGRATPVLLDSVQVESYGTRMTLKNVATISIEDPKTLRILPWDKSQNKEIERALHMSNLGFSISVDDAGVRVIIPALTTERRVQLVKLAKERLEDARIAVRKAREVALHMIKDQDLPEDTEKRGKDEIQKLVDDANGKLEDLFKKKEIEVQS